MPNLKPDGFQIAAHLMIPKSQHCNSFGREKLISHLVFGALVGKTMSTAVKFNRQFCFHAVEVEKVNAASILTAEFETSKAAGT